jgi:hypothetical protein
VGAEHIFIYDNGSTDDSSRIIAPFLSDRRATLVPWATFDAGASPQRQAYAHAICNFGRQFRWMAFIDLDEFLFPVNAPDLRAALANYEDCPSLCVPWLMFGFSGHETPPAGLVVENFTWRAPFPPEEDQDKLLKWKSIVQPDFIAQVGGVHMFGLASGITGGFDERKVLVTRQGVAEPPPTCNVIRLNHYYTRSRQEFAAKLDRPYEGVYNSKDLRKREAMAEMIEANPVRDEAILRFVPALRERVALEEQLSA